MSQYVLRSISPNCFRFVHMCFFQVSLLSRWIPKYLALSATGICWLLIDTGGQVSLLVANVTWVDFVSLILMRHFLNHSSIRCRCLWRLWVAICGSEWEANTAVSSANVAVIVSLIVGRSAVNSRYNSGPSTLPWGTPDLMGNKLVWKSPYLTKKCLSVRYDLISWNKSGGRFCLILKSRPTCHTLSKAWETSINTAEQYLLPSKSFMILSTTLWICSIVACCFLKPNWWSGIRLFARSIGVNPFQ